MFNDSDLLSQHLQDSIVRLMITDKDFLVSVRSSLRPEFFSSKYTEHFFIICAQFFDFHSEPPQDHFSDELKIWFKKRKIPKDEREVYVKYADKISTMKMPTVKYVRERINDFVKAREFELGMIQSAEMLEDGNVAAAQNRLFDSLKAGIKTENLGQFYHAGEDLDRRLDDDNLGFLMPFGIPELDKSLGGLYRSRLMIILGKFGLGKSWFLTYLAKQAIKRGLNVLHISHEMEEDEVQQRYDMVFGAMTQKAEPDGVIVYSYDKLGKRIKKKRVFRPCIAEIAKVKKVRQITFRLGGKLVTKFYPMQTATMDDIKNLIHQLEHFEGFLPDLILNDYPDAMAQGLDYKDLDPIYGGHKGLAGQYKACVVVPSQVNDIRASERCKVGMQHMANAQVKNAHTDAIIAFGQSQEMKDNHQIFIEVLKSRNTKQPKSRCIVGHALDIGQFRKYSKYYEVPAQLLRFNNEGNED